MTTRADRLLNSLFPNELSIRDMQTLWTFMDALEPPQLTAMLKALTVCRGGKDTLPLLAESIRQMSGEGVLTSDILKVTIRACGYVDPDNALKDESRKWWALYRKLTTPQIRCKTMVLLAILSVSMDDFVDALIKYGNSDIAIEQLKKRAA